MRADDSEEQRRGAWWVVVAPYVCMFLIPIVFLLGEGYADSTSPDIFASAIVGLYAIALFFTFLVWMNGFSIGAKLSLAFLVAIPPLLLFVGCDTATAPTPETPEETKHRVIQEIAAKLGDMLAGNHPDIDIRVEGCNVYTTLNTTLSNSAYDQSHGISVDMHKPDSIYAHIWVVGPIRRKPLFFNFPQLRRSQLGMIYMVSYSLWGMEKIYIALEMSYSREADLATVERIKHSIDYYADKQHNRNHHHLD